MEDILEDFLSVVANNYQDEEINLIKKALDFASKKHSNQVRKSKEPYIIHPLMVSTILGYFKADANTICASLLHDTIEDTDTTKEEICEEFNSEIASMVDGVTKIKGLNYLSKEDGKKLYIRKVTTSVLEDARIIIIKLIDRLHNMQTLSYQNRDNQIKIANETLEIYAPLAYFLGMYRIKFMLEDLSFKYLEREKYDEILKCRNEIIVDNNDLLEEMINLLKQEFQKNGINASFERRTKNVYGIYKRLKNGEKITNISDILRIKVIVNDLIDCYQALGIIHSLYHPYNAKFKDYISNPKTNMYRALHTTVFALDNQLVQLQIRTKEMNYFDSLGIVSYWSKNKENAKSDMQDYLFNNSQFIKTLQRIDKEYKDTNEFIKRLYEEILKDKIYLYYDNGIILEMPKGSLLSDLYHRFDREDIRIIINDGILDLDYELKNNDRIHMRSIDLVKKMVKN